MMKKISTILAITLLVFATSCKEEKKEKDEMSSDPAKTNVDPKKEDVEEVEEVEMKKVTAELKSVSNSNLSGMVTFTETNGEVKMVAEISGVAEGKHAIHIHENGDCSAADGKSAGGHWNPTDQPHGKWGSEKGYHKGDIGNFMADKDGKSTVTVTTSEWCVGCGDKNKDVVGKAIIIHDGTDDFTSQPSGAAGTRIGCGVIK